MTNYKKLYYNLFSSVVDLTEELEEKLKKTPDPKEKILIKNQIDSLIKIQLDSEERFISNNEKIEKF